MEPSSFWEANRHSANQEFSKILWNPKVHYGIHKGAPLLPTLDQMNPVHTNPLYFSKIRLILSAHLYLVLPSVSFSLVSPPKSFMHTSFLPWVLHTLSISSSWLDRSNHIWKRVRVMKILSMPFFLRPPTISSLFGPNILRSTLFSNNLSLCSSQNVRDQFHTHIKLKLVTRHQHILIFLCLLLDQPPY
jgi:hypothetical protein